MIRPGWNAIVLGPHNQAAWLAVRRLKRAIVQGRACPLLLLHGVAGTGKSLLIQALVQRLARHPAGRTARIVAARELDATDDDNDQEWSDWLSCDLLAIEDLQYLRPRRADRLTGLLDARRSRGRWTALTSATPPGQTNAWPARLTSRLAGGLVVPLHPPAVEARAQIVTLWAARRKLRLESDVVAWLAASPGSVRELVGHTEKLRSHPTTAEPLTVAQAQSWLGTDSTETIRHWLHRMAQALRVSESELLGRSRQARIVQARQAAMYTLRCGAGLSLPRIARIFERDHTTVLHAIRKTPDLLAHDPALERTITDLLAELFGRAAA
jgi:chromosomal replication initiator protein